MEAKKNLTIVQAWQMALQSRSFQVKLIITIALLVGCAFLAPLVFSSIQQRDGIILNDWLLEKLPAVDLSNWIFTALYILIISSIVSLASVPSQFLITLQAYVLLTAFRFITLLIVPLNPPIHLIELNDPFVQYFFYQQSITKDLFFSGHTSLLFLLAISAPHDQLKLALKIGTFVVGVMLLFQHIHYTIDIGAAPFFAILAYRISLKLK